MKLRSVFAILVALLLFLGLPGIALALIGDLDINGLVDDEDMQIVSNAYGSHSWNPVSTNWDWRADLNKSGKVDLSDLAIAGYNFGATFNFHWPRRVSNGWNSDPNLTRAIDIDTDVDNRGFVSIVWHEYGTSVDWIYFTQLDPAGNTVIEDTLIDKLSSDARLAVDAEGNVHIVWHATYDAANGKSGVLYTRLDSEGRSLVPEKLICDRCLSPAIDTDSYGHPHIVTRDSSGHLYYLILDDNGNVLLDKTRLNTQFSALGGGVAPEISIDSSDTRHIVWYEDTPGTAGDLIYTRIPANDIPSPNQLYFTHINAWNPHRVMIQSDSNGAAHILWHDYRGTSETTGSIFWKRINPDGSVTDEVLVTNNGYNETPLEVSFVIDANDRIHYAARDKKNMLGYGLLDRNGNALEPFQTVYFEKCSKPIVATTTAGNATLVFQDYNGQTSTNPLMILASVADTAANEMTRPDLVLDYAHADANPWIARVVDSATITVTVTNGGWAEAGNIVVNFDETISHTPIAPENISTLPQYASATIVRTFSIPLLEDVSLLPIRVSASIPGDETTLANNIITLTLGVIPPAHSVDLTVAAFDETYAPDNQDLAAYLLGGQLSLEVPALGYQAEITSTRALNGFIGVPLDQAGGPTMPTQIRLTLSGPGYNSDTLNVTATRLADDPYRVSLTPASPIPLYVNRWGTIQGTVYTGTASTTPLANAKVKLDGSRSTTTDATGQFEFTRVISGSHTLVAWHAGNVPTAANVNITTSAAATPSIHMPPTSRGYVSGVVTDDLGRPFGSVTVYFKGGNNPIDSVVTNGQGYFSFEVANVAAYPSYTLEASCGMCDPFTSDPFVLIAGLPETYDFTLSWTLTAANLRADQEVTSWEQVERFNKLDEDEMSIGQLIKYKVKSLVNKFKSYEVDVWWAKYHYALGMNYSDAGGVKTVQSLSIDLANYSLYSYDAQVGRFHGSVEDIDLTALRVDRVDLVQVDASGNVIGDPFWSDNTIWYANDPDSIPTWRVYNINSTPTDWSQAALRIFLHVGKYSTDPDTSHWEPWHPPVPAASLSGSGSAAGSDYQCLIWRLSSNEVEVLKSLAYYADVVSEPGMNEIGMQSEKGQPASARQPAALVVSLDFPAGSSAQIGASFPVDVTISGASDQPVYALEFDLAFDPAILEIESVEGALDFAGNFGSWAVTPSLAQVNTDGKMIGAAVVRLGASTGVTNGRVARIYFSPVAVTNSTGIQIANLLFADASGETFEASQIDGEAQTQVLPARLCLPILLR
jgi:hypothetical protein